ncbi:hypothetical protein D9613_007287 [Agrocybe pediades]|uniref:pyranose dehydrogenase (acceptor) n=1 Tax=Agrocybe pediades TaxID=84607 RepID=A0A8H4QHF2_9AGAR|nr:hypothetical protein D9613_007287 [Agrocybe pediades]
MVSLDLLTLCLVSLSLVNASPAHDIPPHHYDALKLLQPRNYISPSQRSQSYDYIIAGGGLAGLVLASRLSEDPSVTVLVLEAGPSGDDRKADIDTPSTTYFNSLLGKAPYDWVYSTVAQKNANGRVMSQPRGRVLGGSSTVNGMYYVRPSKTEVDAWSSLISPNSASSWSWDPFFDALKATETFTPPSDDVVAVAGMKWDASSHGTSGRLRTTYPGYMLPLSSAWLPSLSAAGISTSSNSYAGTNVGGMFALSTINPSNWTRSYARSAFLDPLPPRKNLHVMFGVTVERVTFNSTADANGNKVASGVQFSTEQGAQVQSVSANKEVVLAGGAMGTPHLLLVSGVGPKDVLSSAGVNMNVELGGVGQHFMDHLAVGVFFPVNQGVDTQGSIHASGNALSKTPEFNSFINSGVAYVNGSALFGSDENFQTFLSGITSDSTKSTALSSVPSTYDEVKQGYEAIYDATTGTIMKDGVGLVEILLSVNAGNGVAIQAALQQPLSHGRLYINSASVYDKPLIDPQYFTHPADITILRQGVKLARAIGGSAPLSNSLQAETTPGPDVSSDADIEDWLRQNANTEYHPCGGAAMLPKEKGGVVDADLKVYGTSNLRVVDSSVFPVSFSAHLMAPTYALAYKAADIILAAGKPQTSSSSSASSASNTGTAPAGQTNNVQNQSGAGRTVGVAGAGAVLAAVGGLVGLLL